MLNFLKRLFIQRRDYPTGAIEDNRTEEQKLYAYDSRELVSASQIVWKEKTKWNTYPVKRQWYTFECVAHSTAKHLGINNERDNGQYVDLSAGFFYWYRINKPTGGMVWSDAMKLATSRGSAFNFRRVQRIRESEPEIAPNDIEIKEALDFIGKDYIEDKERTMHSIAQIIEQQGSCLLWFYFDVDGREWWTAEPQKLYNFASPYDRGTTRHAVIATDYGLRNGKKVIKIEDSAGNETAENQQDRFIDEAFLSRCFVAGYVVDKPSIEPITNKPKWTGKRNLQVGMSGADVKELQEICRYEGTFTYPTSTGFFGGITRKAVIDLQNKFADEILKPVGLTRGSGLVYKSTRSWLEKHFG